MRKIVPFFIVASLLLLVLPVMAQEAPEVDIDAERAAVLDAFVEAKQAVAEKDVEHFVSFFSDDVMWLPPNAPRVTGKDAMREYVSEWFAAPGLAYSFPGPGKAEVSRAGDLGYTVGSYEVTVNNAEGNPVISRGKVVVVWKKQPDGSWKAVLDIWNSDGSAASE
jgi:ketosteroid isomerase-like protein